MCSPELSKQLPGFLARPPLCVFVYCILVLSPVRSSTEYINTNLFVRVSVYVCVKRSARTTTMTMRSSNDYNNDNEDNEKSVKRGR